MMALWIWSSYYLHPQCSASAADVFTEGRGSLHGTLHVLVGDRKANWCNASVTICEDFQSGFQNSSGTRRIQSPQQKVQIFPHELILHHSVVSMALVLPHSLVLLRHSRGCSNYACVQERESMVSFCLWGNQHRNTVFIRSKAADEGPEASISSG